MYLRKILYILRHAKAETGLPAQEDHARGLAPRGIEAAKVMGEYFKTHHVLPAKILCSDAKRTRETWMQMANFFNPAPSIDYVSKLYLASANEMLNVIGGLAEDIASVIVVAHSPGVHQLCLKLAKAGDEDVMDQMFLKFPTCAFAAIDLGEIAWVDARDAYGTLMDFTTPALLTGQADD